MTLTLPTNDWDALNARVNAERTYLSDAILRRIAQGFREPCSTYDLEEVAMDALRAVARDLPSPAAYARTLETGQPELAEALRDAYFSKSAENCGYLRVDEASARKLRSLGLVDVGSCCLGVFGMQVRKALLDDGGTDG